MLQDGQGDGLGTACSHQLFAHATVPIPAKVISTAVESQAKPPAQQRAYAGTDKNSND
jgi:hypothetical protein